MADILEFTGYTSIPIEPKIMLETIAAKENLQEVLVLAMRNGEFVAFGSSSNLQNMNYLCDRFKYNLVSGLYTGE